jgi:hypothetical protein
MELKQFDNAAHTLTDLLVHIFCEAEKQPHLTKWQFAQSVLERFIQLLSLLEEGVWAYNATDSWAVYALMGLLRSDPISVVSKYDTAARVRMSKG